MISSVRVLVSARVFSTPVGGDLKDTVGQFFAAIPASFSIALGQSTELVGVHLSVPSADSQLRYNFGLVETSGQPATVQVQAR